MAFYKKKSIELLGIIFSAISIHSSIAIANNVEIQDTNRTGDLKLIYGNIVAKRRGGSRRSSFSNRTKKRRNRGKSHRRYNPRCSYSQRDSHNCHYDRYDRQKSIFENFTSYILQLLLGVSLLIAYYIFKEKF